MEQTKGDIGVISELRNEFFTARGNKFRAKIRLHVVRKDVLLHNLGGFAEPPVDMPPRYFSEAEWAEIERIAAKPPGQAAADIKALAYRCGRPAKTISVHVSNLRRHGPPLYRRRAVQ